MICGRCEGSGRIIYPHTLQTRSGPVTKSLERECEKCHGSGQQPEIEGQEALFDG